MHPSRQVLNLILRGGAEDTCYQLQEGEGEREDAPPPGARSPLCESIPGPSYTGKCSRKATMNGMS